MSLDAYKQASTLGSSTQSCANYREAEDYLLISLKVAACISQQWNDGKEDFLCYYKF